MDNVAQTAPDLTQGHTYAISSIILGIYTLLTPQEMDMILKLIVGAGSIITAFFACRNYILNSRKTKGDIENQKKQAEYYATRHKYY